MSDKKPHQKNRKPVKTAPVLTPEQQAAALAAMQKAEAEAKAERERIRLYGNMMPSLSHRQLRGELRRVIRREHAGKPPQPQAGLTICLATILSTVLDNTKTVVSRTTRPDQVNPFGVLQSYPR